MKKGKRGIVLINEQDTLYQEIVSRFPPEHHNSNQSIIYEKHIPCLGVFVTEGDTFIYKRKKKIQKLSKGTLFGIDDLINARVSKYTFHVHPGSKISIISKSALNEILENPDDSLHVFFKDLVSS